MIIRSAFDVVDFEIPSRSKPIFAWLCAERSAGVWRSVDESTGILIQEALAAMESWHRASGDRVSVEHLQSKLQDILQELNPDCAFGPFHQFKVQALSSVAHALAAAIAEGDDKAVEEESSQAAFAEISMIKGAYYRAKQTYAGVYDHESFSRQIDWQLNDLKDISPYSAAEIGPLLSRATEQGLLLAEDIRCDRLI